MVTTHAATSMRTDTSLLLLAARIRDSRQRFLLARAAGDHAQARASLIERALLVHEWELQRNAGGTHAEANHRRDRREPGPVL